MNDTYGIEEPLNMGVAQKYMVGHQHLGRCPRLR